MLTSIGCFLRLGAMLGVMVALASAQIGGGSLVGNVMDPAGAAVAGARVIATNPDTGVSRETVTNEQGYFEFPLLPAGRYQLAYRTHYQRHHDGSWGCDGPVKDRRTPLEWKELRATCESAGRSPFQPVFECGRARRN